MTTTEIEYRSAHRDDVSAILSFIQELAEFEQLSHEVEATKERLEATLFCDSPVAHAMVATADGVAVGYALWFYTYSTFQAQAGLYLEDLYVQPDFRRRGIGLALLQKVAGKAVEQGCGRFEWSVLDWNSDAIRLYQSFGAKLLGDWRRMRLEGAALTSAAAVK